MAFAGNKGYGYGYMATIVFRKGIPYQQVTVAIPCAVREKAREFRLSMSSLLEDAINAEANKRRNGQ